MSAPTTSINVTLPVALMDWVDSQIEGGLYADVSDYFRDLIRRDQRRNDALVDAWKRYSATPQTPSS